MDTKMTEDEILKNLVRLHTGIKSALESSKKFRGSNKEPESLRTHLNLDALKAGWKEFKERTTEKNIGAELDTK